MTGPPPPYAPPKNKLKVVRITTNTFEDNKGLGTFENKSNMKQTVSTIIQYLIILALIVAGYFIAKYWDFNFPYPDKTLNGFQVVFFSLSFAFVWVEVLKIFAFIKPFNCIKCMTGWVSCIMALVFHTPLPFFYLFVGLFVGALFDAIKNRYL